MHEFKEGDLESGKTGKKVTNQKQAVAIALSEAREDPEPKSRRKAIKKLECSILDKTARRCNRAGYFILFCCNRNSCSKKIKSC